MKKVILITGANRGIGYGIAEQYAINRNFKDNIIIMTSKDKIKGENAINMLVSNYPDIKNNILFHQLNIRSNDSIKKIVDYVKDNFKRIDVLYNNAGVLNRNIPNDIEQRKKELIETFETNFFGIINLTNAFLPLFEKQNLGHIVNVSSELGKINLSSKELCNRLLDPDITIDNLFDLYKEYENAFVNQNSLFDDAWDDKLRKYGCYPVSKMFLNIYTLILSRQLIKKDLNIKINSCTPGWCRTGMGGDDAIKSYVEGSESPYFLGNFTDERNDSLSGNFFYGQKIIPISGSVIDESNLNI